MSPALSDLPVRKVVKALESVGFSHVRTKGSHAVYRNREGRVAVIPQHGVVKRGTLASRVDSATGGPDLCRVRARVRLNAALGHPTPDFPPQSLQLSLQCIQLGVGDADQFVRFGARVAPSVLDQAQAER